MWQKLNDIELGDSFALRARKKISCSKSQQENEENKEKKKKRMPSFVNNNSCCEIEGSKCTMHFRNKMHQSMD